MRSECLVVSIAFALGACGDSSERWGSSEGILLSVEGELPPDGAAVVVEWSPLAGQLGTTVEVDSWPGGESERSVPLEGIESPVGERFELSEIGGEGTISMGWILVETADYAAAAPNHVLVELSADAPADSWVALQFGRPLPAGLHLMATREWTAEEDAEYEACVERADDPERECAAFKLHASVASEPRVPVVVGALVPDLS